MITFNSFTEYIFIVLTKYCLSPRVVGAQYLVPFLIQNKRYIASVEILQRDCRPRLAMTNSIMLSVICYQL